MDEQSLVQRVQQGEREAFGDLIGLHASRLRGVLALTVPAAHLIDELAHETFVFAFTRIHEFRRGTSFSSWLAAIARNLVRREALRYSRDRRNRMKYAEGRLQPAAPRDGASFRLERLETMLRQVAPRAKQLLEWRYRESLSTAEIARRLGRTDTWVRTTLSRIRQELRVGLETR